MTATSSLSSIKKVLIANRGEIAVRCIRACRAVGVASVSIFTQADSSSLHVKLADESVLLGGHNVDGYLSIDEILKICRAHDVDAVIPGYGFLSENTDFAKAVTDAGMIFVGPSPDSIREMGLKHRARELAISLDVPVVPGTELLEAEADAVEAAQKLGFPIMLKATGGGGGMGLQVCHSVEEVTAAFARVQSRAGTLFKNVGVFMEKYYQFSRHVEVQVFGNGEVVAHFGERECSIQRRHQKVIEECPSPFVEAHPGLREEVTSCATRYAAALKYKSAGTVEFLVDDVTGSFFFLEMNTRLQVEHGITELCYGVDLVSLMLRQADYESQGAVGIPSDELLKMQKPGPNGAAIEVRVYAEVAHRDFAPSPGLVQFVQWPSGEGIRVDTWVQTGQMIAPFYDPLIAKVMTKGVDRNAAAAKMLKTLGQDTTLQGPMTNLPFLHDVIASDPFLRGETLTNFLSSKFTFQPCLVDVLRPGAYTTIQDYPGRPAQGHGIPRSGPMDDVSARIANLIVGNPVGTELLEITISGPELLFTTPAVFSVCGASAPVSVDGRTVTTFSRQVIQAGEKLEIGAVPDKAGCRAYLAIKGGFPNVAVQFGSKSTTPNLSYGGIQGRQLLRGDSIALHPESAAWAATATAYELPKSLIPDYNITEVYVMRGPHDSDDIMTPADREMLYNTFWKVGHNSSRSGVRLVGPAPQWARENAGEAGAHPSNRFDYGYPCPGGLNWGGDSSVLFAVDSPSLGGLITSSTVVAADLWRLGQLRPGGKVRLRATTYNNARVLQTRVDDYLVAIEALIQGKLKSEEGLALDLELPEGEDEPILKVVPADGPFRPEVVYRQGGDTFLLVEFGLQRADILVVARIHQLVQKMEALKDLHLGLNPNINSLTIEYDPKMVSQTELMAQIDALETSIEATTDIRLPTRRIELPAVLDHPVLNESIDRYRETVRSKAAYLPDNLEYLRQNNGLPSRRAVFDKMLETRYLIAAVGFFLGTPILFPLNPTYLTAQKYNPTRVSTPGGAIGLGGSLFAMYPKEAPGGYMLVARTLELWDTFGTKPGYAPAKPWLFEPFDVISYYEVSLDEYRRLEGDYLAGKYRYRITKDVLNVHDVYEMFQRAQHDPEVQAYKARQARGTAEQAQLERTLYAEWTSEMAQRESDEAEHLKQILAMESLKVESPMDANVWKVEVAVGDVLKEGQLVAILEAMKMEINVYAPKELEGATVRAIAKQPGSTVAPGDCIVVATK